MKKAFFFPALVFLAACFDAPIQHSVKLDEPGTVIDRDIRFKYRDRYAVGFSFRPTFVTGDAWRISEFSANEMRAWAEICATVEITIVDSSSTVRMNDTGLIAADRGWSLTNGSQDGEYPASASKFLPFTPVPGEVYRLKVVIVEPCPASRHVSPRFFIERPMAGP